MEHLKLILSINIICLLSLNAFAQGAGDGPGRFYNVKSYKADVTITLQYRKVISEEGYNNSIIVSQKFQHFFTTTPGQPVGSDMFQVERGDKGPEEAHEGDLMENLDMEKVSEAIKNSGLDPSILQELEKTQQETQGFHMGMDKYKIWMADPASGGLLSTSVYSKYTSEESGAMHCGEGQGMGTFRNFSTYEGSAQAGPGKPDINNPNGILFLVNLDNNSYSFTVNADMPKGFKFTGKSLYSSTCGESTDGQISSDARAFLRIKNEKEGLVYKKPLPESGMFLSGTEVITDRFFLDSNFPEDGDWSVRIDWKIYPSDMEVPEVYISFEDEEAGKKWIPEDGNFLKTKMTWDVSVKPDAIEWTLYNVSAEPGTSLNSKNRDDDHDLTFDLAEISNGYKITRTDDGYILLKEGDISGGKESVRIQSLDFGSYGQLSGKIRVNGTWWEAKQKALGLAWQPIPWDENNNMIADEWEKQTGIFARNYQPTWDEDPEPANQFSDGDGFTLYEEYRGFTETGHELAKAGNVQVKGSHVRMDPEYKDVFIYDRDGLFRTHYAPTNAANLNWHYINPDLMQKEGTLEGNPEYRCVNFNTTGQYYYRDQYAIVLADDNLNPDPAFPKDAGFNYEHKTCRGVKKYRSSFPLNCIYKVSIFPAGMDNALAGLSPAIKARVKGEILTTTVIHEIGHALGIRHHWDAAAETITEQSKTMGVPGCSMRYETNAERSNANNISFLKTRYCTKGETWVDPAGKTIAGDNCYGQIDIKGQ